MNSKDCNSERRLWLKMALRGREMKRPTQTPCPSFSPDLFILNLGQRPNLICPRAQLTLGEIWRKPLFLSCPLLSVSWWSPETWTWGHRVPLRKWERLGDTLISAWFGTDLIRKVIFSVTLSWLQSQCDSGLPCLPLLIYPTTRTRMNKN